MKNKLITKDFNFIGFGIISVSLIGTDTELSAQPFLVSKTKEGLFEAIALNFGTVSLGTTEDEAIRNMSLSIFTYAVSFMQAKAPIDTISRAEYMGDFFAEYARLSITNNKTMKSMLNFFYKNEKENSYNATGNYYKVA
ncbi:MAG: hypothetical protein CR988_07830 [Treponema sp.]|nr:MAG: hypothetical protein CR988_07830 [Treponema sp.]